MKTYLVASPDDQTRVHVDCRSSVVLVGWFPTGPICMCFMVMHLSEDIQIRKHTLNYAPMHPTNPGSRTIFCPNSLTFPAVAFFLSSADNVNLGR